MVLDKQWSNMLDNHWLGPYLIRKARLDLGTYLLSKLDRAQLNRVYVEDKLIRFFQREGSELDGAENAAESGLEDEVEDETDYDELVD